ncbi:MAG TPA: thiamine pyrophosphate-requiring protein [Candidatus Tectomicrobia bacterium]|nr:thiamine pyrophosphate-requiring protein [Candidatus Tectomicrobia bacterium]
MPPRTKKSSTRTVAIDSTAEAYLELLRDRGIEYFFGNGGTDFAPLVEAFAKLASQGITTPKPITVPHEYVAVSMADGFYRVSGRPQAVMVHVIVGTANAAGAIMNAARAHVPILFSAGRTPITEEGLRGARNVYIHWAQESFDQGSIVREFVKWDYELRNFSQIETVVDRALEVAMAEPRGPVYLTLPREVLAEEHLEFTYTSPNRHNVESPPYPAPERIKEAAQALANAKSPLIVTQRVGAHANAVKSLVELAESFAIPVVSPAGMYMNFPSHHPLHLGYISEPLVREADVILVIDADVPWFPAIAKPKDTATVIQMGIDPFFSRYPVRGYPCDIPIVANPSVAIPLLTQELGRSKTEAERAIGERFKAIKTQHEAQHRAAHERLAHVQNEQPLDFEWVSHCIDQVKDDETILVNEYDLNLTQVHLSLPGSYFAASPAAGLGWGAGAALGVKLAAPEKMVIATLGEGAYMFGCPTAAHFVSRAYHLPVLFVIFNNQCWNAVKRATRGIYPHGWAAKTDTWPLTDLTPSPSFERMADVHGGYGELVEDPTEVLPALRRGLRAVREEKRQAILNIMCKHA